MPARMTDQQLLDYSGEHLMHELSMLWETTEILRERKEGTAEYVAILESFAIHLRNLIDFFYRPGLDDDVVARNFLDLAVNWTPIEPPSLTKAHKRANKELSHLTRSRISGNPPEKAWDTSGLLKDIEAIAKEFAAKASANKLHPKVAEFLSVPRIEMQIWIGKNVAHSNVASHALTSRVTVSALPGGGASTHTQIITTVDPTNP